MWCEMHFTSNIPVKHGQSSEKILNGFHVSYVVKYETFDRIWCLMVCLIELSLGAHLHSPSHGWYLMQVTCKKPSLYILLSINRIWFDLIFGVYRHFQQYFSYIMALALVVEEAGVPGENHRPWASNWETLSLAASSWMHPFL